MFCDLRNFTTFSETAEPEEVLGFLAATTPPSARWSSSTRARSSTSPATGSWSSSTTRPQEDHAARAVRMAVAIRERFVEIAEEWRRRGHVLQVGHRDRDRLRDDGPDRLRGPLRLRRRRQRDHPRVAPQQRGGRERDPHLAADVRCGRWRGPDRGRRATAQGLQPADAGLQRRADRRGGRRSRRRCPPQRCPDDGDPDRRRRRSPSSSR